MRKQAVFRKSKRSNYLFMLGFHFRDVSLIGDTIEGNKPNRGVKALAMRTAVAN